MAADRTAGSRSGSPPRARSPLASIHLPIVLGVALLLFPLLLAAGRALAQAEATVPFQQGKARFSLNAGYGSVDDKNYVLLGLGAGYYLWDGLEAGLDGQAWLGQKPHIYELTPEVRYTLTSISQFFPYVGGFYRRTFYDSRASLDSAGGRVGVAAPLSAHAYVSGGLVYEHAFQCDRALYSGCSQVYPEAALSFSY